MEQKTKRVVLSNTQVFGVYKVLQEMDASQFSTIREVHAHVVRETGIREVNDKHVARAMRDLGISLDPAVQQSDKVEVLAAELRSLSSQLGFQLSSNFIRAFGGASTT